jgi:ribosome-binding factor A
MAKYRKDRINESMAHALSEIVRGIKDPRVSRHFVSVVRTEVTPDLKYCKVFFSVLAAGNEEIDPKEIRRGLISASGFIRTQIAQRLNLRITPEFQFVYDDSMAYGAKINTILHSPSVKEDIRRFDERAEEEARLAALAAAEESENDPEGTASAYGDDDEYDEFDD